MLYLVAFVVFVIVAVMDRSLLAAGLAALSLAHVWNPALGG